MKGIQGKIMKPVRVLIVLFITCSLLQLVNIFLIYNQVMDMNQKYFATLRKADELKLSVVQVQQWLTDISATRAAEGYDDGLKEAAVYADHVRALVAEIRELGCASETELNEILNSFEPYYTTGVKMANAYIEEGPAGGNVLMEEFDAVAQEINERVDAFTESAEVRIESVVATLFSSVVQSSLFMFVLTIVILIMNNYVKRRIAREIVNPIFEIEEAAKEMAAGSLQAKITYAASDEIGQLAVSLQEAMDTWNQYIIEIKRCMKEMQEGNLKIQSKVVFQGDFIELQDSILTFVQSINRTMTEINQSAEKVTTGSGQIAKVAQTLSEGAVEQNISIEELMSNIKEMTEQVREEAKTAEQANQLMERLGKEAADSMAQMNQMVHAMEQIAESSNQIVVIIKSIEDIASQTNLLSLNASIEAARAGEAGRGFAVVAGEVAGLAGESGKAANNTAVLIENSREAVEKGRRIADNTAKALSSVEEGIHEVVDTISLIAKTTRNQSEFFKSVTQDMTKISDVVTTVSATAQESEAASEELLIQANQLNDLVDQFKV